MIEVNSPTRKNKISLEDYPYRRDIENRLLMSQFTTFEFQVLEEILYSPLKTSVRKLAKNLDVSEVDLLPIVEQFAKTGLLELSGEEITVDKEMRKYYESQILKFDEEFAPGMEFLQSLLRKVPIHVLPSWYSIPRTSNNIFDSIIEKYLLTPQIFQRYLAELNLGDPILTGMAQMVFAAPDFKVFGSELMEKYQISREQFEINTLYLEFNFVCCLGYEKVGNEWKEVITPFYEWREYLRFLRDTEIKPLPENAKIEQQHFSEFAFTEAMSDLLSRAKRHPIPCEELEETAILAKLRLLKLAEIVDKRLCALDAANDWLDMNLENRALFVHRHPLNRLTSNLVPHHLATDRNIREAEKSLVRAHRKGWILFDDFIKGVTVPLGEQSIVMLKRNGKTWKYTLPSYSDEEKELIKATLFQWLPEVGMVITGKYKGQDCFKLTHFGESIFGSG